MICRTFQLLTIVIGLLAVAVAGNADQTDPRLPELFDSLKKAGDASDSREVESQIWQIWLEAPDSNADLLMRQVTQAMSSGQLALALRLSNQLVDSSPTYAEAWNKRATVHYLLGDDDQSVADIRETLLLEPRHFGAISGLGLIFVRQGNMDAALDAFEQVLEITPASASARQSIERVQRELGREI
ncbi:MAG: tetratricopeptide repeat protein [Granulosicoccus sp.]|nr:tetratricopeptide repeat protein [Granulosicoccus sp.]